MKTNEAVDVREIRRKLGMNQSQFWSKIGVTQSGGSRYESGRNIPRPVQALLRLVHIDQIDITKIRKEDIEVIEYLKSNNPDLFKTLKKEVRKFEQLHKKFKNFNVVNLVNKKLEGLQKDYSVAKRICDKKGVVVVCSGDAIITTYNKSSYLSY